MNKIGPQRVEDVWGQGCKKLIFYFVAGHVEPPKRAVGSPCALHKEKTPARVY
jgi:hypothetical protein